MPDLPTRLQAAVIDRYRIERELGRGGMATVYLANDLRHERPVALKVLHPELAATLGGERFLREIRLAAKLQHPHILPVFDSGEAAGLLWYSMPYVEGETLRDRLSREGQLPVSEAVRIAGEVGDALQTAHEQGIVHRDIKPENILLSRGHAVVADFGVAHALGAAGGDRLTSTGLTVGTPAYMSPEQASGGRVDCRSDVYALGCVLYELLAGEPPFSGATPQAVIAKRFATAAPPVRILRPDVPAALEAVVAKALAQVPGDRFATAAEFGLALARPSQSDAGSRRVSKRWLVLGASSIAAAVLAGVLSRGRAENGVTSRRMLVVLPFENLGRPEDEYFAEGMADELNTRLAGLRELGVIDRQSALRYKGSEKSIREIGRELGVQYVLAGSVRWERPPAGPSRVRISPRLIRVSDASPVWTKPYDAVLTSVFELQADVAMQVAEQLDVALASPERQALQARPTENLAAYDAYLRGKAYARRADSRSLDDMMEDRRLAVAQYAEATRLDSMFVAAYTNLAITSIKLYDLERSASRAAATKAAIDRALALDPASPDARIALGSYQLTVRFDTTAALRELDAARARKPNDADLLATVADVQWYARGPDTAALHLQARALQLDPQSVAKALRLAEMNRELRRYDEAERWYDRTIALDRSSPGPYIGKARLYLLRDGDLGRARKVVRDGSRYVDSMVLVKAAATNEATWFALGMLDESYQRALLTLPEKTFELPSWHAIVKGYTYRARNDLRRARAYYDTARVIADARYATTGHPWDAVMASWPHAVLGNRAKAYSLFSKGMAGDPVTDRRFQNLVNEYQARLSVLAGDYDSAVAELTKDAPFPESLTIPWLRADPFWDPLRSDPRFQRLLSAAGKAKR